VAVTNGLKALLSASSGQRNKLRVKGKVLIPTGLFGPECLPCR